MNTKSINKQYCFFYEGLTNDQLIRVGIASNSAVALHALGYAMAGHTLHHLAKIKQKYLLGTNSPLQNT